MNIFKENDLYIKELRKEFGVNVGLCCYFRNVYFYDYIVKVKYELKKKLYYYKIVLEKYIYIEMY